MIETQTELPGDGGDNADQDFLQDQAVQSTSATLFVVLYRWRLRDGAEASFVEAWSRVSALLLAERGSLGSRLHRGPDGVWYSYAQWPSAEARDRAFAEASVDPDAVRRMNEAVEEEFPETVLEPVADFMRLPPTPVRTA